jgi:predicted nucleic acid-binding protein
MNGKTFVDTNILIYAHDTDAGDKHSKAREVIRSLLPAQARGIIESYLVWEVVQNDSASILRASELEERYQFSFWDALIITAALEANAEHILTEDLNHGQLIEGVLIVNPFR